MWRERETVESSIVAMIAKIERISHARTMRKQSHATIRSRYKVSIANTDSYQCLLPLSFIRSFRRDPLTRSLQRVRAMHVAAPRDGLCAVKTLLFSSWCNPIVVTAGRVTSPRVLITIRIYEAVSLRRPNLFPIVSVLYLYRCLRDRVATLRVFRPKRFKVSLDRRAFSNASTFVE